MGTFLKNSRTKTFLLLVVLLATFPSTSLAKGQEALPPASLLKLKNSPSPYECAALSFHVYQNNTQPHDSIRIIDQEIGQEHILAGWEVHEIFTEDVEGLLSKAFKQLGLPYGYQAVLYINQEKKQAVLAHRGTELQNMSAVTTDISSIASNAIGGQERSIPRLLDQALSIAQHHQCSLTITGHSLGGWLAQLTAFIARDRYPDIHVKAITFDTPGAYPMLTQINARIKPIDLNLLDITNYLSSPNLINACNQHIGTVYRVVFNDFCTTPGKYTVESHNKINFLRAFDPQSGMAKYQALVEDWPLVSKDALKGSYEMLTSNKVKAIFHLLVLFKKFAQHEALGEYSGFFKLADQAHHYHADAFSLEETDSFDINYKYHYKTKPYDPSFLHIRHVPQAVYYFLEGLYKNSPAHLAAVEEEPCVRTLKWDHKNHILTISNQADINQVVDKLISLALKHASLCKIIGLVNSEGTSTKRNLLLPPSMVSFFVGRAQELKILTETLSGEEPRIIAPPITGAGGIGKSQLALKFIDQQRSQEQYEYVFWIPAETREKLVSAYARLAEGLGIYIDHKKPAQAIQLVGQYLQNKLCLYVFDNAPTAEVIQDFLPIQRGHVLITSRNSNSKDWLSKPLVLDPFSKEEALELGKIFGYAQTQAEEDQLKALLSFTSPVPLGLLQLFSFLEEEGLQPAQFLKSMRAYDANKQEAEVIKLIAEQPSARTQYAKSLFYIFKTSLEQLQKEAGGDKALSLLQQLAYVDSQGIVLEFLLTLHKEDASSLKSSIRAALSMLEQHSLLQWNRHTEKIYVSDLTQRIVRQLYPQPSFVELINSLVAYVSNEKIIDYKNPSRWYTLLVHGRKIFERLDMERHLQEAFILTKYLVEACRVHSLVKEEAQWSQQNLDIAHKLFHNQNHVDYALALYNRGVSLYDAGKYQDALTYHQQAFNMYQQIYQKQDHADIALTLNSIGKSLIGVGKYQDALTHHQQALAMYQCIYRENIHHPVAVHALAFSLDSVGITLGKLGQYESELAYKKQALAMYQELYKEDLNDLELAHCLESIGVSLRRSRQNQLALSYYKQTLAIYEHTYQDHCNLARILNKIGRILSSIGQHQEGLAYCMQALAMQKRMYGDIDHPVTAKSLYSIGYSLAWAGQYQEGVTNFEQALAMQERMSTGNPNYAVAKSLYYLGYGLYHMGQYQKALTYLMQALEMDKQNCKHEAHFRTARTLHYIGLGLASLAHYQEALTYVTDALEMRKSIIYNKEDQLNSLLVAESLNSVGMILAQLKQYEEASKYCQQALDIQQRIYQGQDHPDLVNTSINIGEILLGLGKYDQALDCYQQTMRRAFKVYPQEHPALEKHTARFIHAIEEIKYPKIRKNFQKKIIPLFIQSLGKEHKLVQLLTSHIS